MQFFWPGIDDPNAAEREYLALREFLVEQGYPISDCRIFEVEYTHHGVAEKATVGQVSSVNREEVKAIYVTNSGAYLICTPSRGADRIHLPIFTGDAGDDTILRIIYFLA